MSILRSPRYLQVSRVPSHLMPNAALPTAPNSLLRWGQAKVLPCAEDHHGGSFPRQCDENYELNLPSSAAGPRMPNIRTDERCSERRGRGSPAGDRANSGRKYCENHSSLIAASASSRGGGGASIACRQLQLQYSCDVGSRLRMEAGGVSVRLKPFPLALPDSLCSTGNLSSRSSTGAARARLSSLPCL